MSALGGWLRLIALAIAGLAAAPAARAAGVIETRRLANGMTVIVSQDANLPRVAVASVYRVGYRDDPPDRPGLSHLLEHVLIHPHPPSAGRRLGAGVGLRAETSVDFTRYLTEVTPGDLGYVLWLEALRLSAFDRPGAVEAELPAARNTAREEELEGVQKNPLRTALWTAFPALYPAGHPYRGIHASELATTALATRSELAAHHRRHYRPENLVVAIVGNVDEDEVFALVDDYLATVPASGVPFVREPVPPIVNRSARLVFEANVTTPRLWVDYPMPAVFSSGEAEAALLDRLLTGPTGELAIPSLREPGLVDQAWVSYDPRPLGGLLRFDLKLAPAAAPEEALARLDAALARLRDSIGPRDRARVVAHALRARLDRGQHGRLRAVELAEAHLLTGSSRVLLRRARELETVTVAGLRAALDQLRSDNRLAVHLVPAPGAPPGGRVRERSEPPESPAPLGPPPPAGPARAAGSALLLPPAQGRRLFLEPRDPPIERVTLANGLVVLVSPRRDRGLVYGGLVIGGGSADVPASHLALPGAAAHLALGGEQDDEREQIGAVIEASTSWRSSVLHFEVTTPGLDRALGLLAASVARPAFAEDELERWRRGRLRTLRDLAERPLDIAQAALRQVWYPDASPLAHHPDGTLASVAGLTTDDLRRYHRARYQPAGSALILVGDVDVAAATTLAERHFGAWHSDAAVTPSIATMAPVAPRARTFVIDRPGARHASVLVAAALPDRAREAAAAEIVALGLGRSLKQELRQIGLAYQASCEVDHARPHPTFQCATSVAPAQLGVALGVVDAAIERQRAHPPHELGGLRQWLVNQLAVRTSTLAGLERVLRQAARTGSDRPLSDEQRAYEQLLPDEIRAVAHAALAPEQLVTIVIGDRAAIAPSLARRPFVLLPNPLAQSFEKKSHAPSVPKLGQVWPPGYGQ